MSAAHANIHTHTHNMTHRLESWVLTRVAGHDWIHAISCRFLDSFRKNFGAENGRCPPWLAKNNHGRPTKTHPSGAALLSDGPSLNHLQLHHFHPGRMPLGEAHGSEAHGWPDVETDVEHMGTIVWIRMSASCLNTSTHWKTSKHIITANTYKFYQNKKNTNRTPTCCLQGILIHPSMMQYSVPLGGSRMKRNMGQATMAWKLELIWYWIPAAWDLTGPCANMGHSKAVPPPPTSRFCFSRVSFLKSQVHSTLSQLQFKSLLL